jgi:hypothetical protein
MEERTMLGQIRIYTINRGEMDAFLKHFQEETMPLHERLGIPIVATWVNRPQNEFIWIRTFADEQDRDAKMKAFQEAARAAGIQLGGNVAKMEVRETEPAFAAAAARA